MSFLKRLPIFSFDFWQKFGKALMVVVAVMPVAGIMISLGKALDMVSSFELVQTTARLLEDMGWAVIGNLHILFAVAIGGSWAKRSEEHTSELQSRFDLVCRLLLEKKNH